MGCRQRRINSQLRKGAWLQRSFTLSTNDSQLFPLELLVHYLNLLVEHLAAESVNRYACLAEV